ncbi:MAG: ABC transporter permease [Verrucomicrobiae bacterium]|nr:ABC transporter permease [Verrucomicrobiae bacterium]
MLYHQFRGELWKLFGKKRTYIGFAMFLLAQNAISLGFKFTTATGHIERLLNQNGYLAESFISALTIAVIMMVMIAIFLLPLYSALVGGDFVAKESEDGTLRMILCRPISRWRLLAVKWLAGCVFSALLVLALGGLGLLSARVWFPWGGLFVFAPEQSIFSVFNAGEGLERYLLAQVFLIPEAVTIMTLAFMFSCFNIKPAAATILAMSVVLISFILQHIPYFRDYQNWILTYHLNIWVYIFEETIPWWRIGQSLSLLLGFNATFFLIGATVFHLRDIKS